MSKEEVKTRIVGGILEVTVDRPKANAIDRATSVAMGEVFASFRDNPDLRVAIDFFLVRKWQGTPSGIEGQALQWFKPSELSPELLLPADAPVLELLHKL